MRKQTWKESSLELVGESGPKSVFFPYAMLPACLLGSAEYGWGKASEGGGTGALIHIRRPAWDSCGIGQPLRPSLYFSLRWLVARRGHPFPGLDGHDIDSPAVGAEEWHFRCFASVGLLSG